MALNNLDISFCSVICIAKVLQFVSELKQALFYTGSSSLAE